MSRWAAAIAAALLAGLPGSGLEGQSVVTVCPAACDYAEVQEAIDEALPGETVQIWPGTYEENLVIRKSLTLQGAGRERTIITGREEGEPVVLVEDDPAVGEPPEVEIAGLEITGGRGYCRYWPVCADGVLVRGRAQVTITDTMIVGNGWGGIALWDEARAVIEDNLFSTNRRSQIGLWGSSWAAIQDNQLLQNGDDGIVLQGRAQATIEGNQIEGSICGIKLRQLARATIEENLIMESGWDGIELRDEAQAVITDNRILGNGKNGLQLRDHVQASIIHNQISGNENDGVVVWHSAQASLANNTISQNRNGILLGQVLKEAAPGVEGSLKFWGNSVFANRGWGIAIYSTACGFAGAPSPPELPVKGGENEVRDNGRGELCPEDYPWPEGFTASG